MLLQGWPKERLDELYAFTSKEMTLIGGHAFSGFTILGMLSAAFYGAYTVGINGDPDQLVGPAPPGDEEVPDVTNSSKADTSSEHTSDSD